MKKILVACFFTILMLLVPMTTVGKTINNDNKKNNLTIYDDCPIIYLTQEEKVILDDYVDDNYQGSEKSDAEEIVNNILEFDDEYDKFLIDVDELTDALETYSNYEPISDETLEGVATKEELLDLINEKWKEPVSPFENLINKIIQIIKDRLGWLYRLFADGVELFSDGVDIAIDIITAIQNLELAKVFAAIVNLIILIPFFYFSESLKAIFNLDIDTFISTITEFTDIFTVELGVVIDEIQGLIDAILYLIPELEAMLAPIISYINRVEIFVDWLTAPVKPWQKSITISGVATTVTGQPLVGAQVSCRGVTATTNSQGEYEFIVTPDNTSEDSIPAYNWYGMHNCQITISEEGKVLRQTPKLLSYVFSEGKMTWTFLIIKARTKVIQIISNIFKLFDKIFERAQILSSIILNKFDKISAI